MSPSVEPYTFSQFLIDAYYDTKGRFAFILKVQDRYPEMDKDIIETFWHVIDFMNKGIS